MGKQMKKILVLIFTIVALAFISCATKNGQFYYNQADAHINSGKYKDGLKSAIKAESLFSQEDFQWKEIVVLEGEAYLWMNDEQKALKEFNRVFDYDPEDEDMVLNIAATCFRTQKYDILELFCQSQLKKQNISDKTKGLLYYYYGHLIFAKEDYREAKQIFQTANECFVKCGFSKYDDELNSLFDKIREMSEIEGHWEVVGLEISSIPQEICISNIIIEENDNGISKDFFVHGKSAVNEFNFSASIKPHIFELLDNFETTEMTSESERVNEFETNFVNTLMNTKTWTIDFAKGAIELTLISNNKDKIRLIKILPQKSQLKSLINKK